MDLQSRSHSRWPRSLPDSLSCREARAILTFQPPAARASPSEAFPLVPRRRRALPYAVPTSAFLQQETEVQLRPRRAVCRGLAALLLTVAKGAPRPSSQKAPTRTRDEPEATGEPTASNGRRWRGRRTRDSYRAAQNSPRQGFSSKSTSGPTASFSGLGTGTRPQPISRRSSRHPEQLSSSPSPRAPRRQESSEP